MVASNLLKSLHRNIFFIEGLNKNAPLWQMHKKIKSNGELLSFAITNFLLIFFKILFKLKLVVSARYCAGLLGTQKT